MVSRQCFMGWEWLETPVAVAPTSNLDQLCGDLEDSFLGNCFPLRGQNRRFAIAPRDFYGCILVGLFRLSPKLNAGLRKVDGSAAIARPRSSRTRELSTTAR